MRLWPSNCVALIISIAFIRIFVVFICKVNDKRTNIIMFSLYYNVAMCKCCKRIKTIGPMYKRLATIARSNYVSSWDKSMILTSLGTPKTICILLQFNIIIIILCLQSNLCRCWFANSITFNINVYRVQWSSHIPFPLKFFNQIIKFSTILMR